MSKLTLPIKEFNKDFPNTIMSDVTLFILLTDINRYDFALAEEYIDVVIFDNSYSSNMTFYMPYYFKTIPCLRSSIIHNDTFRLLINDNNIVPFFKRCLDDGYYLWYMLDAFCFSAYDVFRKEHQEHGVVIFGYDDIKNGFLARDSFDFKKRSDKYLFYDEIDKSIEYNFPVNFGIDYSGNTDRLQLFKPDQRLMRAPNLHVVKQKLERFISNDSLGDERGIYYGIQMFDIICKRIQEQNFLSLKNFSFIQAHALVMKIRCQIISRYRKVDLTQYSTLCDKVIEGLEFLKMLGIKKTITETLFSDDSKRSFIERIRKIEADYRNVVQGLISVCN